MFLQSTKPSLEHQAIFFDSDGKVRGGGKYEQIETNR